MAYQSLMAQAAQGAVRAPAALGLAETGRLGERIARIAMRRRWARHLREEYAGGPEVVWERFQILLDGLRQSAIDGERGHKRPPTELPPELFELTLGPHMHHASGYFGRDVDNLADAESSMLELCAERAQLEDGQKILELGCGWGSMTLWMAQHLPNAQITTLCRSPKRKRHLEARCEALGVNNVRIIEGELDKLTLSDADFDRVLSIEMFEHLRNFEVMLARIAGWLRPNGTLFVHMICHRELMYTLENPELVSWLGEGFCCGRLMASANTLHYFQRHLILERHWRLSGTHYQRTIEAWLQRQNRNRAQLLELFAGLYGRIDGTRQLKRLRLTLLALAEMFGYADGGEWAVAQYRFAKQRG